MRRRWENFGSLSKIEEISSDGATEPPPDCRKARSANRAVELGSGQKPVEMRDAEQKKRDRVEKNQKGYATCIALFSYSKINPPKIRNL